MFRPLPFHLLLLSASMPFLNACRDSAPSSQATNNENLAEKEAVEMITATQVKNIPSEVTFNDHVQPILSEYCYHCHGPDSGTRAPEDAPLRLDIENEAFAHRSDSKLQPIVKGDPALSNIIQRMKLPQDDELLMPPKESHKTMGAREIAIIEKWIEQGAEYQKHWSFIPPEKKDPTPLKTIPKDWVKNPIDAYTAAKMEEHNLTPNLESDPERLLRRLTLDITGLPPYPDEVESFKKAHAKDPDVAISDAVDRLLASDEYAENMTRHWLDAVRYADTHGIHIDNKRNVWPYRDWVIRAFQQNMPFDQFTIEQHAGDLLPNATLDQKVATGFGRALPTTGEGGAIPEEYDAIYAQDRTDTTAAIYLGLTMGCAACHDHKFDPISQKDNYSLNAFFRNTTMQAMDKNSADHPPVLFVPNIEDRSEFTRLNTEIKKRSDALAKVKKDQEAAFKAWAATAQDPEMLSIEKKREIHIPFLNESADSFTANIKGEKLNFPTKLVDTKYSGALGPAKILNNLNIELGDHASFSIDDQVSFGGYIYMVNRHDGPIISRMDASNKFRGWEFCFIHDNVGLRIINDIDDSVLEINIRKKPPRNQWHHVWFNYNGKEKNKDRRLTAYLNGKKVPITYRKNTLQGDITTTAPLRLGAHSPNTNISRGKNSFQDFRFYRRALTSQEITFLGKRPTYSEAYNTAPDKRDERLNKILRDIYFPGFHTDYRKLQRQKGQLEAEVRAIRSRGSNSLVMKEKKGDPFAHILVRGEYSNKADKVSADVPEILPPLPEGAPKNRLGLAQWLVSRDNPLTARVTMNRFWYYFFGDGIVTSNADFGIMGARPSHPKLLDYLAVEFMESGWDQRHMIKLITTSATYRQSQTVSPEKKEIDAPNTYLARGPRYRMDAEQIRDTALFASGLLSKEIGGPPVKPYQPVGVWKAVAMPQSNTKNYRPDSGEKLYRRSLYSFWKRTAPMANMEILNAPSREVFCVRRDRTNTPLQAFVTLNDVQFIEASRNLAQRALLTQNDFDDRIDFITTSLLSRTFSEEEKAIVKTTLEENLSHYAVNKKDATALITQGESKPNTTDLAKKDLAAWTITASQIFNLDENLNK